MVSQILIDVYNFSQMVLDVNLEGISHNESLVIPSPGGNCINWVVGHILYSRKITLELLGESSVLSEKEATPYKRGVKNPPISDMLPLERLIDGLHLSKDIIARKLSEITESELTARDKQDDNDGQSHSKVDQLFFLRFHESYHIGQLGLLRRLIGKEGAIS